MAEAQRYEPDNGALTWVLAGTFAVSAVVGVLAYWRYAGSETYVAEGITEMKASGGDLDVEGCFQAVIDWHHDCDINGANAAVCEQGLKLVTYHCLAARDRSQACEDYQPRENGKWVLEKCEERGMRCVNKRECACAEVYRTIESFCLNDGEAVQL